MVQAGYLSKLWDSQSHWLPVVELHHFAGQGIFSPSHPPCHWRLLNISACILCLCPGYISIPYHDIMQQAVGCRGTVHCGAVLPVFFSSLTWILTLQEEDTLRCTIFPKSLCMISSSRWWRCSSSRFRQCSKQHGCSLLLFPISVINCNSLSYNDLTFFYHLFYICFLSLS